MNNRTATDTIKGYFYQFDYSIKRILEVSNEKDSIVIEGIEDIDIETATETNAVQCKYYSKTEYNHSVIAKPIRLMLDHFIDEKRKGNKVLKYLLYGFYHSGHHKLSLPLSIDNLKNNFLTYTTKGLKKYHHTDIGASDSELNEFISALEIDINAQEYNSQLDVIFNLLKKEFNCTEFESEHFYYNNALNVIKQIAVEPDITRRKISKTDFISKIDYKTILFNQWFLEYKGLTNHFKALKKEYFTGLNSSPFDRFFLIDLDAPKYKRAELKDLILMISKKWSKISKRESKPFCPFIHINGIEVTELIELKKELYLEEFFFIDGHPFHGADFNVKSLLKKPNPENGIVLKFINEINHLEEVLGESNKTKEIYQFYFNSPYYVNDDANLKHIKIQINQLRNIKEII